MYGAIRGVNLHPRLQRETEKDRERFRGRLYRHERERERERERDQWETLDFADGLCVGDRTMKPGFGEVEREMEARLPR